MTSGVPYENSWFAACSDRITKESLHTFDGPVLRAKLSDDWEENTDADLIQKVELLGMLYRKWV